jgi:CheY-like chemotaxis protein
VGHCHSILLLEPDSETLALLAERVRTKGYEVSEAATPDGVLARIRACPAIDIVVFCHWWDVVADLAARLKEASVATIVFTGALVPDLHPLRLVATVVTKPWVENLLAAIRKAITGKESPR